MSRLVSASSAGGGGLSAARGLLNLSSKKLGGPPSQGRRRESQWRLWWSKSLIWPWMRDNCNKTPKKKIKNHKKIFLWCSEKKMCIINISYKRHFFPILLWSSEKKNQLCKIFIIVIIRIFLWCSENETNFANQQNLYRYLHFYTIILFHSTCKHSYLSFPILFLLLNHQKYTFVLDFEKNHFTSCTCWLSFIFYLVHFQHRVFKITKVFKDKLTKCWMMKSIKSFPDWNRRHHRFIGHQIIIQILIKNSEKNVVKNRCFFSILPSTHESRSQ